MSLIYSSPAEVFQFHRAVTKRYVLASSAKSLQILDIIDGMSFMNMTNNTCPSTEPCGIPLIMLV